jgi:hypothetical protein
MVWSRSVKGRSSRVKVSQAQSSSFPEKKDCLFLGKGEERQPHHRSGQVMPAYASYPSPHPCFVLVLELATTLPANTGQKQADSNLCKVKTQNH